ncbi:hypothetical protein ABE193_05630 [Bacillus mycoides]|jgi:hypothetical protein|uniref:hypothetical protein n=1 Tax=Bacillus mycoides TaxID=1405 RepID=UPI003D1DC818
MPKTKKISSFLSKIDRIFNLGYNKILKLLSMGLDQDPCNLGANLNTKINAIEVLIAPLYCKQLYSKVRT